MYHTVCIQFHDPEPRHVLQSKTLREAKIAAWRLMEVDGHVSEAWVEHHDVEGVVRCPGKLTRESFGSSVMEVSDA